MLGLGKKIFLLLNLSLIIIGVFWFLSCSKDKNNPTRWVFKLEELKDNPITWDKKQAIVLRVTANDKIWLTDTIYAKYRGGFSSRFHKKSFSIKLNNPNGFGFTKNRVKWILNANYIDKTFLRHVISYDLFRKMNPLNISPKCQYVEVYFNNDYKGLYVLMERIDETKLSHELTAESPIIWKEPKLFHQDTLYEDNPYNQKYPKEYTKNYNYLLDTVRQFLIYSPDTIFNAHVFTYFDEQSIIDWYLILLFSNNSDGLLKNFYLYKTHEEAPLSIALWDYDHSYGRDGDNEMNLISRKIDMTRNLLFKRVLKNNTHQFKEKSFNRWKQLRKELLTKENLDELMNNRIHEFSYALAKNDSIWPTSDTTWYYDQSTFEEEIEIMRIYFKHRLVALDSLNDTHKKIDNKRID